MQGDTKKKRITVEDVYRKQEGIEAILLQILQRLPLSAQSDILMPNPFQVDKNNAFWDDDKKVYSLKKFRENNPREKGDS
jgi:hypothetical protein